MEKFLKKHWVEVRAVLLIVVVIAVFLGAIAMFFGIRGGREAVVNEEEYSEGPDISGLIEENPILKSLPIKIDYFTKDYGKRVRYTISYKLNEDLSGFKIVITDYTGGNYEDAIEKLRARGAEIESLEVEYVEEIETNGRASD